MNPTSPAATVLDEVATWAGITTQPTPRGATAIVFEGHELGHVHANRGTLDLPLPADRRAQVLEAGRAKEWFSGWVTKQLASRADAVDGIALLRESYDALHALLTSSEKSHS
jgi:hypothetical protein